MMLSEHFSLAELTRSGYAMRHGLDNAPPSDLLANGVTLAMGLERVRTVLKVPIHVESGYRSPRVNRAVGGKISPPSQHQTFSAADIVPIGMDLTAAMHALVDHEDFVRWDQLIFEGSWLHISFVSTQPRGDILVAHFNGAGGTSYSRWIGG